jgi:hypothetical protein
MTRIAALLTAVTAVLQLGCATARAQEDHDQSGDALIGAASSPRALLVDALVRGNARSLERLHPSDPVLEYQLAVVLTAIPISRQLRISFEREGAQDLLAFLNSSDVVSAIRDSPEPDPAQHEIDVRRFATALLAHAVTVNNRLVIDAKSIAALRQTIDSKGLRSLCPCWPICSR